MNRHSVFFSLLVATFIAAGSTHRPDALADQLSSITQGRKAVVGVEFRSEKTGVPRLQFSGSGDDATGGNTFRWPVPTVGPDGVQRSGSLMRTAFTTTDTVSGFCVGNDGYVMTMLPEVQSVENLRVILADGQRYDGERFAWDDDSGLTLLRIADGVDFSNPNGLAIADASVAWGDDVATLSYWKPGNPALSLSHVATQPTWEASIGARVFELDSVLRTESVGAPVLTEEGRVAGIVKGARLSGGTPTFGTVVDLADIRQLLDFVAAGNKGAMPRPWMGIAMSPARQAVEVSGVSKGSPAEAAGVQEGDQLQSIDGRPVTSTQEMLEAVAQRQPGETVALLLLRNGEERTIFVVLEERPKKSPREHQVIVVEPSQIEIEVPGFGRVTPDTPLREMLQNAVPAPKRGQSGDVPANAEIRGQLDEIREQLQTLSERLSTSADD